ncbi:response regulator transcription factor [Pedobacter sp. GSP4]|uniref:response regulator transcription factor n=1 Tax=Pedobacter sp. GSP4 TaxID=3453716 RepID=UPI003EEF6650
MPPKIMIIDDHPATLDALKMIFEFEGYLVLALSGATHLHAKVNSFQPDVILIDVLLGFNDGRAICRELKLSIHAAIPLLIMSSRIGLTNESFLTTHCDDYMEKPFEMETIVEKVRLLVAKRTQVD